MTAADDLARYEDENCTIIWDRRYLPVLVGHIRGEATMEAIDFYFKARNETLLAAEAAGQRVVIMNDMTHWVIPPATVRKSLGDKAKNDVNIKSILHYVNIVPSPVLRGVITAISWLTGDQGLQPVRVVASMKEARQIASRAFEQAGIIEVPDLDTYSPPD